MTSVPRGGQRGKTMGTWVRRPRGSCGWDEAEGRGGRRPRGRGGRGRQASAGALASASGLRTWARSPVSLCGGLGTLAQAPPSADEDVPRWTAPRPCPRKRLVTCLSPGHLPAGELTHVTASEDTPSPGRSSPPGSSGLSARPGRCQSNHRLQGNAPPGPRLSWPLPQV